ncbi:MAG: gliding motility-associated-like protein [Paraglaciecola sp.]|jgi:gliding motility-associated-like protein
MKKIYFLFLFLLIQIGLQAQETFNMSNQMVDNCEGLLIDSELGDLDGHYDHNEDYTFTICVDDAEEISLSFLSFCTELGFDFLTIYDGPNTASPQIGSYSGTNTPPTAIATSGCMTINFVTDANVTCTGWTALWEIEFIEPDPPLITSIAGVTCETTTLTLTFDRNIHCDSIYAEAFSITGPIFPEVIDAMPSPCVGDSTNTVVLTLNDPIDFSGTYEVFFSSIAVVCEEVFILQTQEFFAILDCPLEVDLVLDGSIECAFEEHTLIAEAMGGNPASYSFVWAPIFVPDNTDEVTTIVYGPTTYYVTVTDAAGATATDSLLVTPMPAPTIYPLDSTLYLPDTTICQSVEPFFLTAFPPGGTWEGQGIAGDGEDTGYYNPQLLETLVDVVTYTGPNDCQNQITLTFTPLEEGTDDAACIGVDTFAVSGGMPMGGIWTGEYIDSMGLFTPPDTAGNFLVTYTHPNGCVGDKWVYVDTLELAATDSVCQSDDPFMIPVEPFGGVWIGSGITNEDTGRFDPDEANAGDNIIFYEANGCSAEIAIYVTAIEARGNFSACPEQEPFLVPGNWYPQQNSSWSGLGIIDPITGLLDPSLHSNDSNLWLTLEANGCTDRRRVFVFQTTIHENDTLRFCPEGDVYELNQMNTDVQPKNGVWTGPGIYSNSDDEFFFDPTAATAEAGFGYHYLIYTRNTCADTLVAEIFPTPEVPYIEFCETESPSILEVTPAGGTWSGDGIINPATGVFNPDEVGVGTFTVYNESDEGCLGQGEVAVIEYEEATITGLDGFYCFQDNNIPIQLFPAGGIFEIDSMSASPIFNPATAGTGLHTFSYIAGEGPCINSTSFLSEVGEELFVTLPTEGDTVCFGQNYTISAQATGGNSFGNYTYDWNQGLGFGQTQYITSSSSNVYTVTAKDGCSDPATANFTLAIQPSFSVEYDTGDPVCYEDTTFATAFAYPSNDYTFEWNTFPPIFGPTIESQPTFYDLTVTNDETGCTVETQVTLPGYDLIEANFSYSPTSDECLTDIDPTIQLLDFSVGGTSGIWDFGDSLAVISYQDGENLSYTYSDTGTFIITLFLQDEGDCTSQHQETVCIKAAHRLYAPNAFTPNRDGVNDYFQFTGVNIETLDWQIFDRYGLQLYIGNGMDDKWDGKYGDKPMPNGAYVFTAEYTVKETRETLAMRGYLTIVR